jgi:hypothetical protein
MMLIIRFTFTVFYSYICKASSGDPYPYPYRERYYYSSLSQKMSDIIIGNCSYHIMPPINHVTETSYNMPKSDAALFVFPSPISEHFVKWYMNMPKPLQMRVDPGLCDIISKYKRPIFNNTGCQLRHYMSLYAPRCQTKHLKRVCDEARLEVTNTTRTGYVLPEADHSLWENIPPPTPYLLVMKDVFVTQCGQASLTCGMLHTTAHMYVTINKATYSHSLGIV